MIKTQILVSTVALFGVLPGRPIVDVSLPLIEYRVLGPIGQVWLTASLVHDPQTQKTMLDHLASFDKDGLILVAGRSVREFRRRETIGSHSVETDIHVYPATGRGYRGGLATADVVVRVDGKKKIDCPYISGPVDLTDVGISPIDGTISISGSDGDKRIARLVSLDGEQTIDLAWLERNAK